MLFSYSIRMYNHSTMPKSEIGEVIKVIRQAPPRYHVRLPYGEMLVVEQSQIEPQRMTLLPQGTRLRIIHDLGRVLSASTDLLMMVRGNVRQVVRQGARTLYQVETEQGKVFILDKSQVTPHPARDLLTGAELDLRLSDTGQVTQAILAVENDQASGWSGSNRSTSRSACSAARATSLPCACRPAWCAAWKSA